MKEKQIKKKKRNKTPVKRPSSNLLVTTEAEETFKER